ncbi:MAG: hypothetical protein V1702_03615 [Candidatus Woesearchaeota archaeon]
MACPYCIKCLAYRNNINPLAVKLLLYPDFRNAPVKTGFYAMNKLFICD